MDTISRERLAELLHMSTQTLYLYLDNYRFNKHKVRVSMRKMQFVLSDEFKKDFYEYLFLKRRTKEADIFKRSYCTGIKLPTYKEFLENQYATIDCGFWDKDGNYKEDLQQVDKREIC